MNEVITKASNVIVTAYSSADSEITALTSKIEQAKGRIMAAIRQAAAMIKRPIAQDSKEHKELRDSIAKGLIAKGLKESSARVESAKMAKLVLFITNDVEFEAGNVQDALAELNGKSFPFWTSDNRGRKPSAKSEEEPAIDASKVAAIIRAMHGDEIVAVLTDVQKVETYLELCKVFGIKPSAKVKA